MRPSHAIVISFLLLLQSELGIAQQSVLPPSVSGPGSVKALVVEQTYLLTVYKLNSPMRLSIDSYPDESLRSSYPYAALQEQFAAMKAGDYARFLRTWTDASQKQMEERNLRMGKSNAFWIDTWKKSLQGVTLELRNVVVYSRFQLLEFAMLNSSGVELAKDTVAFVRDGSRWSMTQELANDPVLIYWNHPQGRVQIPPTSMIPK